MRLYINTRFKNMLHPYSGQFSPVVDVVGGPKIERSFEYNIY